VHAKDPDNAYRADLAYIHDAGFGGFAAAAAKLLLGLLRAQRVRTGLVVDLGSGSGILAAALVEAGYDVLGFDISESMVELSRRHVPQGIFCQASILDAEIPTCIAVTAVGEIFNYLFDPRHSLARLNQVFRRVHAALSPGGSFLFDAAFLGRVPGGSRRNFAAGEDWACLFEAQEDPRHKLLTRQITTFRKLGDAYRRDHEVHRLRLYVRRELLTPLRRLGFRVRSLPSYGDLPFPPGYAAFIARKC
jgi:SAM-dependent methyltransferase